MNKENRGAEVEDLVERVCKLIFLPDLTVRNPKFKKGGKLEKEAADFIVPFHEKLLCFQVKSRAEYKKSTEKTEVEYKRIRRTIQKGIDQLKTIKGAIAQSLFSEFQNSRGITLPIDCSKFNSLIGIVIVEIIGESELPEKERTSILGGFTYEHGLPVHIFKLDVFEMISTEIDTIPDFVKYLETREAFISKGMLSPVSKELDFLAFYKTKPNEIEKCLNGEIDQVHLNVGIWNAYQENHDLINKRDILNQPSYFIDEVIKNMYTSIGYKPDFELPTERNDLPCGSNESYMATIMEFSNLNRIHRKTLGTRFIKKLMEADSKPYCYDFTLINDINLNVLLLSSNLSRDKRSEKLFQLCSLYYCGMKLKKILGIATESSRASERSIDTVIMEGVKFENQDEIYERFKEWNPKMHHGIIKEFE